jgi:hypothetical protein
MSDLFLTHIPKSRVDVAPFGTTDHKWLYVEGKSDQNVFARLVVSKTNKVFVINASDKKPPTDYWNDNIQNEPLSKYRVTKACHTYKHIYGIIDRDRLDFTRIKLPKKCFLTDYRDLESTFFTVGGTDYIASIVSNILRPATDFSVDLIRDIESKTFELAGLLEVIDRVQGFDNANEFDGSGSICIALDTRRTQINVEYSASEIATLIADIYNTTLDEDYDPLPTVDEINGHTIVTALAICIKIDGRLIQHLQEDQLDLARSRRMLGKFENLRLEIENRMQNEVNPPLSKTKLANMLVQELRLTKLPEWFQQSS